MKKILALFFGSLLCAGLLLFFCLASLSDGRLHIYALDIGQGDAILIRTPADEWILVDGGPNDAVLREMGEVMPFYERTIDAVILSHPHADHVNGLVEVLKRYDVKKAVMSGVNYRYAGYESFLDLIAEKNIPVVFVNGDKDLRLGNVILDILYPPESFQGKSFNNLNNSSVVFRLLYGENRFYFSGDLELEGEKKLAESGLDLRADVLKAGHHGSRTSGSPALLDLIQPSSAVISSGVDNEFKHPHPETIEHLQEREIKIFRTDLDGRIELVSDGIDLDYRYNLR